VKGGISKVVGHNIRRREIESYRRRRRRRQFSYGFFSAHPVKQQFIILFARTSVPAKSR